MMNPVLPYLDAAEFVEKGSGVVRFATAPDGLPLLAAMAVPQSAEELLRSAAYALGVQPGPEPCYDGTPLEPLARDLGRLLREQRVHHLATTGAAGDTATPGGTLDVLVLPGAFRAFSGPTLLERLYLKRPRFAPDLDTRFALAMSAAPDAPTAPPPMPPTTMAPPPPPPPPLPLADATDFNLAGGDHPQPKFVPGEARLAISTDGRHAAIVRSERDAAGWPRYTFRRLLTEESAAGVAGSSYEGFPAYHQFGGAGQVGITGNEHYGTMRLQNPDAHWTWRVPRASVARLILGVTEQLAALHAAGEIHGDVKPANVLVTAAGVRVIDSLELRAGSRSPAMTLGWAAPEQILGAKAGFQTDQYAVGLLLLELAGGVAYGEEARISIPTGGTNVEFHTVLRNPGVYIDPATAPVARESVEGWRDLIEQCVRFEAAERFASMEKLITALRPLAESGTLTGEFEVPLSFGRLVIGSRNGTGESQACWLAG